MINARFFIENSQVIGLWIIYSVVMLLAYFILDGIVSHFISKYKKIKRLKARANQQRNELIRLASRVRVSRQVRAVMNTQL